MKLSWDETKRQKTLEERGLDFADATAIFGDPHFDVPDDRIDYGERRMLTFGLLRGRMVAMVWTQHSPGSRYPLEATFQALVYDAPEVLGPDRFDLVFTGIGALCWLPDIDRWAGVVEALLVPGGRLFLREGHPMMWTLDYTSPDRLLIDYPYFQTSEPIVETEEQTYASTEARLTNSTIHSWNHGLGEIVTALLDHGLRLTQLVEHDSIPWNPLPDQMVQRGAEWVLANRPERLPLTYTLQAVKPG